MHGHGAGGNIGTRERVDWEGRAKKPWEGRSRVRVSTEPVDNRSAAGRQNVGGRTRDPGSCQQGYKTAIGKNSDTFSVQAKAK